MTWFTVYLYTGQGSKFLSFRQDLPQEVFLIATEKYYDIIDGVVGGIFIYLVFCNFGSRGKLEILPIHG